MDRYYLDESGHGGDLASSTGLDFSEQPIFALACVGISEPAPLEEKLRSLANDYGCGTGELKSGKLGTRLAPMTIDLTRWLVEANASVFVELVEKRFFLTTHVVNNLLCGPYGLEVVDQRSRRLFAELLSKPDYDPVMLSYLGACRSQTLDDVKDTIGLLWDALDSSDYPNARSAQILTLYARDRVNERAANARAFLPIADIGLTGRLVWMLPNLQSLTNIYGRINLSRQEGLDGVCLVHDAQLQYGKVLEDAKALLEKLAAEGAMPVVPFSDYQLRGTAELVFADSQAELCLQASDILAGCAMRFARGKSVGALRHAFMELYDACDPSRATGVNLVMSHRTLQRLDVPYFDLDA